MCWPCFIWFCKFKEKDWNQQSIVRTYSYNKTHNAALNQIEEKGYASQFEFDKRRLFRIGVNFSSQTRKIEEWKIV